MSEREIMRRARRLLSELEATRLQVILVPDRRADSYGNSYRMIRAVQERNADWYRRFCRSYSANRRRIKRTSRHDTLIKRACTVRALGELAQGECRTVYAGRLKEFILEGRY